MNFEPYEQYDALILDMDGTLVDSGQLNEQAWITALKRYDIPVDRKLMRSLAGVPTQKTIIKLIEHFELKIDATPAEINQFKDQQVEEHIFDYIKPTALEQLVKHFHGKKPMAVGTGALTSSANAALKACKLDELIDFVVGADQVEAHKPAPDTFLLCAKLMNVAPARCVVFEDAALGLEAADRAGMAKVDVEAELGITNDYFL